VSSEPGTGHNGQIDYANMNGGTFQGWVGLPSTPGFTVDAVADINDDGFADIVVQNSSGAILYANMDNGVFSGWANLAATPGFTVVGAGDIAGTGDADVVIQNSSTGQIDYANIVNGTLSNWVAVGATPGWRVIAVEDVNGAGNDDIVVQNESNGQIVYADMSGGTGGTFNGWVNVAGAPGFTGHTGPANDPALAANSTLATGGTAASIFESPTAGVTIGEALATTVIPTPILHA
jgi:hypothetical protein